MILDNAHLFLDRVFKNLADTGIDVKNYSMDHICYRVSSDEEYASVKTTFASIGGLLHEAMIGGRPIATFKLHKPLTYRDRAVSCIELPAPKPGKSSLTGWEHVEFVITESFEQFLKQYPHCRFDTSGIAKSHNPEIELSFEGCAAKFHHVALEDLIQRETDDKT